MNTFKIWIRSLFEKKGTEEAKAALDQTSQAATRAGKAGSDAAGGTAKLGKETAAANQHLRKLSESGGAATQIMGGLRQVAQGGSGAIFGMATAVRGLMMSISAGLGPIGWIAAAVGVVVGLALAFRDKLTPAVKTTEQAMEDGRKAAEELAKVRMDQLKQELGAVQQAAGDAVSKLQFLLDLADKVGDAERAARIAGIRGDKELSDEEKARRIADEQLSGRVEDVQRPATIAQTREAEARKSATRAREIAAEREAEMDRQNALVAQQKAQVEQARRDEGEAEILKFAQRSASLQGGGGLSAEDARRLIELRKTAPERARLQGPEATEERAQAEATAKALDQEYTDALAAAGEAYRRLSQAIEERTAIEQAAARQEAAIRAEVQSTSAGEIEAARKRDDERRAAEAARAAAAGLGADVQRGLSGTPAFSPEAARALHKADVAAEALKDGMSGGEGAALVAALERLAELTTTNVREQERIRRMVAAAEDRIRTIEAQARTANDGR